MALLKSAWEIALEKTANIEADPEKIREEMAFTDGRRLAGSYLTDLENDGKAIKNEYQTASDEKKEILKKAFGTTILLNIALPQSEEYEQRIEKMIYIATIIDGEKGEITLLLDHVGQFMGKYLNARDSLLERAREQYEPHWQQKRERMMQQYGKADGLSLDQDPEFINLVQKSFAQLSEQYQQVLDEAKEQIKENWNL
jgi:hypothetical protein